MEHDSDGLSNWKIFAVRFNASAKLCAAECLEPTQWQSGVVSGRLLKMSNCFSSLSQRLFAHNHKNALCNFHHCSWHLHRVMNAFLCGHVGAFIAKNDNALDDFESVFEWFSFKQCSHPVHCVVFEMVKLWASCSEQSTLKADSVFCLFVKWVKTKNLDTIIKNNVFVTVSIATHLKLGIWTFIAFCQEVVAVNCSFLLLLVSNVGIDCDSQQNSQNLNCLGGEVHVHLMRKINCWPQ